MVDTRVTGHGLHFQFSFIVSPVCWTHAAGIAVMQMTQEQAAEFDCLPIGVQGFKSDRLFYKSPSDEAQASLPFNVAVIAHPSHRPVFGITQGWQGFGKRVAAGLIFSDWRLLPQTFVRTLVVVLTYPPIGTALH